MSSLLRLGVVMSPLPTFAAAVDHVQKLHMVDETKVAIMGYCLGGVSYYSDIIMPYINLLFNNIMKLNVTSLPSSDGCVALFKCCW